MPGVPICRTCLQVWSSLSPSVMCRACGLWISNPGLLHRGPQRPWVSATHFSPPPHTNTQEHANTHTHCQHWWQFQTKYTPSDSDRWAACLQTCTQPAWTREVTGYEGTTVWKSELKTDMYALMGRRGRGLEFGIWWVYPTSAQCGVSADPNTALFWVPFYKPAGLA